MRIFIVLPAYNEAQNLPNIIRDILAQGFTNIVVVDDCSIDQTYNLAKAAGVTVLRHLVNLGAGAAMRTGKDFALRSGADIIVHLDSDGQMDPKEIKNLIAPLLNNTAAVAIGSRFTQPNLAGEIPFLKKYFLLPLSCLVDRLFSGLPLTDPHNGWRAMTRSAAQVINWQQNGFAWATEFNEQVRKHKLNYVEIPVHVRYLRYGQNFASGVRVVRHLLGRRLFE